MNKDKEILIIQNFGPIKDIKLELKKFNVLIGEQATGKSTVAKVLAICRYFSYIYDLSILDYKGDVFSDGLINWKINAFANKNTYIYYKNTDYILEYKNKGQFDKEDNDGVKHWIEGLSLDLTPKSDRFKQLIKEIKSLKNQQLNEPEFDTDWSHWSPNENFFRLNVKKVMNNPFYFPTERGLQSFFELGQKTIDNLPNSLFEQLRLLDRNSKYFRAETEIEHLSVSYLNENGRGYVNDKRGLINIEFAASGYQTSIPIVLSIKYYNQYERRSRTFIVEEPEQNLFPTAQKKLIEFLVKTVNESENQFLLPTHSPYILTTLSNLIYAHKIGTIEKGKYEDKVNEIIPQESWIDVKDIAVYYLKDGIAENMVDEEECIINLDTLDNASEIINTEFDKLLTIEAQND